MRFGASCCPSWDPSNWLSRKVPSLLSALWMSRSQNENQKLLRRSASEEEMFQKKPKRKNTPNKSENYNRVQQHNKNGKHQKSESENNLSAVTATSTMTTVEIVTEGQQNPQKMSSSSSTKADKEMLKSISKIGKVMKSKQNNKNNSVESASSSTTSMVSETTSEAISLNPRRRRSRREQAVLAAKSSRGGGRGSYTAANLRRYAAEHKPTSMKHDMLEKRSQSANALKFSPFNAGTIRLFRCIIWLCLFTYLF